MSVLLATCADWATGEPAAPVLDRALAARGIGAVWASWDDEGVDWAGADLVLLRSTWDYTGRLTDFLAWIERLEQQGARLLNAPAVVRWNLDKAYLIELAEHVPVVSSTAVEGDPVAALVEPRRRWGTVVLKPRVGAGGRGVVVLEPEDVVPPEAGLGTWLAQPLVESIRTNGESSVYVLGGRARTQVDKRPAAGEIRVNEQYGGSSRPAPLDPDLATLAERAVTAVASLVGTDVPYARVDLVHHDGGPVVSELELIEPGLYLDVEPATAEHFADLVAALLAAGHGRMG